MFPVTSSRSPSPSELGAAAPSQEQVTTPIIPSEVEGKESTVLSERKVTAVTRVSLSINPHDDPLLLAYQAFPWLEEKINKGEIINTKTKDVAGRPIFALGCSPEITFIQQGLPEGFCINIDFDANVNAEDDSRHDDFYWSESGIWCNDDVITKDGENLGRVNQKGVCVVMDGQNQERNYKDYSMAWWAYHCSTSAHYPQPQHQHHHKKGKRAPVDIPKVEAKISESLLIDPPELRKLLCAFYDKKEKALRSKEYYELMQGSQSSKERREQAKAKRNKDKMDFEITAKSLKAYIKENFN